MLSAKNRLRKAEFGRAWRFGRVVGGEEISLKFIDNGLNKVRIGFLVGKKAVPGATERNRIKRILKEAVRVFSGEIKNGYDMVIFLNRQNKNKDYSLNKALNELKLIFKKVALIIK